jgi:hypothetical protein
VTGAAQLQISNKTPDSKDRLQWKYGKGADNPIAYFGTPLTTTDYVLCVYDNGSLVARTRIPAGRICRGKPCWSAKPTGFKYKDKDATPDGVQQATLKAGFGGKAKIQVKGGGTNLPDPTLPLTMPVRVQLKNSDGKCWEATYTSPALKNVSTLFKDKGN